MTNNTFSKNILTATASDMFDLCEAEIDRQKAIQAMGRKANPSAYSNTSKQIQKMIVLESVLMSVPADLTITVEGCRGDDERGWALCNAGSIVEAVVKYHMTGHPEEVSKTFGDGKDFKQGCIGAEVKASLTCNSLATPSEAEYTILVNQVGVFTIRKANVLDYVNKAGRLPFNKACGKRVCSNAWRVCHSLSMRAKMHNGFVVYWALRLMWMVSVMISYCLGNYCVWCGRSKKPWRKI